MKKERYVLYDNDTPEASDLTPPCSAFPHTLSPAPGNMAELTIVFFLGFSGAKDIYEKQRWIWNAGVAGC